MLRMLVICVFPQENCPRAFLQFLQYIVLLLESEWVSAFLGALAALAALDLADLLIELAMI